MAKRWIEAFRLGGKASRGIKPEHLAEVVEDDFDANPRALCFGHPKSDDPAAGTISGAKLEGNSLLVEVASLTDKAIEGIKSGEWLNRSAAFFDPNHEANPRPGKWTLRHVGLLGGAAPGIPNMQPLKRAFAFSADGDTLDNLEVTEAPADAVIFVSDPTAVHYLTEAKETAMPDEKTPEMIAFEAREARVVERERVAAERVRTMFNATNNSAIDALVRETKVLPAEAEKLKLAFAALDPEGEELTFGAGDTATKATAVDTILAFMAGLPKRVPVGDRLSPDAEFTAKPATSGTEFEARAEALSKSEGISWDEAADRLERAANAA